MTEGLGRDLGAGGTHAGLPLYQYLLICLSVGLVHDTRPKRKHSVPLLEWCILLYDDVSIEGRISSYDKACYVVFGSMYGCPTSGVTDIGQVNHGTPRFLFISIEGPKYPTHTNQ